MFNLCSLNFCPLSNFLLRWFQTKTLLFQSCRVAGAQVHKTNSSYSYTDSGFKKCVAFCHFNPVWNSLIKGKGDLQGTNVAYLEEAHGNTPKKKNTAFVRIVHMEMPFEDRHLGCWSVYSPWPWDLRAHRLCHGFTEFSKFPTLKKKQTGASTSCH